jgi:hypothetical protein
MRLIASKIRLQFNENYQPEIILTTHKGHLTEEYNKLVEAIANDKKLDAEIKIHRERRSLDSNSYCWVLCQKIAEVIGSTKELVYQKTVRDVGQFEIVPIKDEAVERWIEVWKGKGLGWFAEVMEDSKLPGYKKIISYYGSSVYNQREMSVLINEIVQQCKELGIETLTKEEIESMNKKWNI